MKQSRRKFTAKFKAMVAVETLNERESLSELATRFEQGRLASHPTQVSAWKRDFLERAEKAFVDAASDFESRLDMVFSLCVDKGTVSVLTQALGSAPIKANASMGSHELKRSTYQEPL